MIPDTNIAELSPGRTPTNREPGENYRLKLASFVAAEEIKDSLGLTARQFLQIRPIIERYFLTFLTPQPRLDNSTTSLDEKLARAEQLLDQHSRAVVITDPAGWVERLRQSIDRMISPATEIGS